MSAASIEKRLNEPCHDEDNWTCQDSNQCQNIVEDFLALLNSGQLHKNKHQTLVDTFVKWVQEDPVWGLALAVAPEFREGTVQEADEFPKKDTDDLFHPQEIIDMVERIYRPLTEKELEDKEEWAMLWKESGVTIVGSSEWHAKMKEEHGPEFDSHRPDFGGGFPGIWVAGEPMLLGDVLKAGKKGDGS
ncbi:hypothetical protein XANCAGTX0491_001340 [Xanthoria calcicola]